MRGLDSYASVNLSMRGIRGFRLFLVLFAIWSIGAWGAEPARFRVLTLNAWLLNFALNAEVSDDIEDRLKVLPALVAEDADADVVTLQEVWSTRARDALIAGFRDAGYAYSIFRPKAAQPEALLGNGLLIVSRFPLDPDFESINFSVYTRPDEVFAKKGAIRTSFQAPGGVWVDLYASHLGAVTFEDRTLEFNAEQVRKNLQQAVELAQFIRRSAKSPVQILGADLNSHFQRWISGAWSEEASAVYALFTGADGMNWLDVFASAQGRLPEADEFSFNSDNPYVAGGMFSKAPSETEDYLLMNPNPWIVPVYARVVFRDALPESLVPRFGLKNLPKRLSDHYGVVATFEVRP